MWKKHLINAVAYLVMCVFGVGENLLLNNLEMEAESLHLIKWSCQKHFANITFNGKIVRNISFNICHHFYYSALFWKTWSMPCSKWRKGKREKSFSLKSICLCALTIQLDVRKIYKTQQIFHITVITIINETKKSSTIEIIRLTK